MGTFLKYVFYLALIVVVYLVGKGIFEGQINEKTTVGEVVQDVEKGSKQIVSDGIEATQETVNEYKEAPKKDIKIGE